jgi:hypothetical protein
VHKLALGHVFNFNLISEHGTILASGILLLLLLLLAGLLGAFGNRHFNWLCYSFQQLFASFAIKSRPYSNIHQQPLSGLSFVNTVHRRDIAIVPTVPNSDVSHADRRAQCRIKPNPTVPRQQRFRPSVSRLATNHFFKIGPSCTAVFRRNVTGNIARRKAAPPQYAQQQVRKVLANSRP